MDTLDDTLVGLWISPDCSSALRRDDLMTFLAPLGLALDLRLRLDAVSPVDLQSRPIDFEGKTVAWLSTEGPASAQTLEALAGLLGQRMRDLETITDFSRALGKAWAESNFLCEVQDVLNEVVELDDAARLIVRQLARIKHAHRVSLFVQEGGALTAIATHPAGEMESLSPAVLESLQGGEVFIVEEATEWKIVLPLMHGVDLLGALVVWGTEPLGQATNLKFLGSISAQIAQAVRLRTLVRDEINAAKLRQGLEVAAAIQQELLPQTAPDFEGALIAGACQAAHYVAGDAFDYYHHEHGLDLLVADVSGHGVAAGLLMTSVLSMLRSQDLASLTLPEIAQRINRHICRGARASGQYLTLLYVRLAVGAQAMRYVSMGHPPPLLCRASACGSLVQAGGLPAGFDPDAAYEDASLQLRPGDRLLLYTDGLPEARTTEGQFWGEMGLAEAVATAGPFPATIIESVFGECQRFSGYPIPDDDQTAIAVIIQ